VEETTMWYNAVGCLVTLTLRLLAAPLAADAEPSVKVPQIGVLSSGPPPATTNTFVQALRDLGYVEGQNIAFVYRYAEGHLDRLPAFAAELVRLRVDILGAVGVAAALAAKQATTTIPIVFSGATDPVGRGLVASLARPGGNITGVAFDTGSELDGKRLELLKEAVPTISRVAILAGNVASEAQETAQENAARALSLTLRRFYVQQPEEFPAWVFPALTAARHMIDALRAGGPAVSMYRRQIADFALQHRLPVIGIQRDLAEAGALLSYGPNQRVMPQRAAVLVSKILQGAKPADLPIEQPTQYELVINLKTAKALGITMPPSLLLLADEVIQ
jgi:putative ABC transport system substrate-binding protein